MRARRHATAILASPTARVRRDNQAALERFARTLDSAIDLSSRKLRDDLRAAIRSRSVIDADLLDASLQILEGAFEDAGREFSELSTDRRAAAVALVYDSLVTKPGDIGAVTQWVRFVLELNN